MYYDKESNDIKKYGLTYANFCPQDESSIIESTDWIQDYINEYTNGTGVALTDFDQVVPRFSTALISFDNLMNQNIDFTSLKGIFGGLDFSNRDAKFT